MLAESQGPCGLLERRPLWEGCEQLLALSPGSGQGLSLSPKVCITQSFWALGSGVQGRPVLKLRWSGCREKTTLAQPPGHRGHLTVYAAASPIPLPPPYVTQGVPEEVWGPNTTPIIFRPLCGGHTKGLLISAKTLRRWLGKAPTSPAPTHLQDEV